MSDDQQKAIAEQIAGQIAEAQEVASQLAELLCAIRKQADGGAETPESATASDAESLTPEMLRGLIELGAAAQLARRPSDTVRLWCRQNLLIEDRGFAIKLQGRWFVKRDRFLSHIRKA